MFDDKTSAAASSPYQPATASAAGKNKAAVDQEPAWKSEFRQTLSDIMETGFGDYARKIQEEKLEELRAKILESMGLTEQDLENMSPEQRDKIEKIVAQEIQERLAAEKALDDGKAVGSSDGISDQVRAAPNGLGSAVVLLQALDSDQPTPPAGPDDPTKDR